MGYLDHASSAPLHPAARDALLAAADEGWADPTRRHSPGRAARRLLDAARERVAVVLGARPDEVTFTASGSAANVRALTGALTGRRRVGHHVVTTAVEHSSILRAAEHLERAGGSVTRLAVNRLGHVDPAAVGLALIPETALVAVQHANHEVGTVQAVAAIAEIAHASGVPLLVDAAQTVGRLPVDVGELGADLLTASAHKWGGPAGVGVVVVRTGTRFRVDDDPDERHVAAIVAAAAALEARQHEIPTENPRLAAFVDRIRSEIPVRVPDVDVIGPDVDRLPHLVTVSCLYVDGEALLDGLDRRGIAVSSGSSCTADTLAPSHVLEAMGVLTHGNVRVSLGRDTTADEVEAFLDALPEVVAELRRITGVGS